MQHEEGNHYSTLELTLFFDNIKDDPKRTADILRELFQDPEITEQALCHHDWDKIGPCNWEEDCQCFPKPTTRNGRTLTESAA